jgi:hypothetical protein
MLKMLRHRVDIQRASTVTSATLEVTATYAPLDTNVRALILPRSHATREKTEGIAVAAQFAGYFDARADVRLNDRVTFNGQTFIVRFVGVYPKHIECDLELT